MPEDKFANHAPGLDSPASRAFAITPDDDNDLALTTRAIYVGQPGDIHLITANGDDVTFVGVPVGIMPIRAVRVHATGTNADDLLGLI